MKPARNSKNIYVYVFIFEQNKVTIWIHEYKCMIKCIYMVNWIIADINISSSVDNVHSGSESKDSSSLN